MIAIEHASTGEVQFVESLDGYDEEWVQRGPALPDGVSPQLAVQIDGRWVDDPARVAVQLIAALKIEAEDRKMEAITRGWAKSEEYRAKAAEIAAAGGMSDAELDELPDVEVRIRFPAAWAERALSGDSLSTILARYRSGVGGSMPELHRLSSIEHHYCRQIERAGDADAMREAAAAVDWEWQLPPAAQT